MPRRLKRRKPRTTLIHPMTGSTNSGVKVRGRLLAACLILRGCACAAVAAVIMRLALGKPRTQRQHGLGAVERLNAARLVDAKDHGLGRRIEIEPHHIAQLGDELWTVDNLKRAVRCGCRPCWCQILRMVFSLTPCARAIVRVLQCVAPGGGVSMAVTMAAMRSAVRRVRRPGRGASVSRR